MGGGYLFLSEAGGEELGAEVLHAFLEAAGLVAEGDEVGGEPVGGIVVGAFEGVGEEAEGGAEVGHVLVEVVEVVCHCGCAEVCRCG